MIVKRNIGLEYALDNDLKTRINAKTVVCCSENKQEKAFKKIKTELMLIAQHPTTWWD